jgi:hypothetical protein
VYALTPNDGDTKDVDPDLGDWLGGTETYDKRTKKTTKKK